MKEIAGEYYKLSDDRLRAIAELSGVELLRARAIITYPWPDSSVHQGWLDEASVEEIAYWVRFVARMEDEDRG